MNLDVCHFQFTITLTCSSQVAEQGLYKINKSESSLHCLGLSHDSAQAPGFDLIRHWHSFILKGKNMNNNSKSNDKQPQAPYKPLDDMPVLLISVSVNFMKALCQWQFGVKGSENLAIYVTTGFISPLSQGIGKDIYLGVFKSL